MSDNNGFMVITDKDWETASEGQRAWMTFNTLKRIDERLKRLEKRTLWDKFSSFCGGVLGGIMAALSFKIGGN